MIKYFLSIMLLCGIFTLYGCVNVKEPLVDLGGYEHSGQADTTREYDTPASNDAESDNRQLRDELARCRDELARKERKNDKLKKELDRCEDKIDRLEDEIEDLEDDD